jgi:uncharacterized protein YegL
MTMKDWSTQMHADDVVPLPDFVTELTPEPRAQAGLVLDVSGSMSGPKIESLIAAVREFGLQLKADELGRERVEVSIVTVGGPPKVAVDFVLANDFAPPTFIASGGSPVPEGIWMQIELIQRRRATYKRIGIDSYKPCVLTVTDGGIPHNDWFDRTKKLIHDLETTEVVEDRIAFFTVGVDGADMQSLAELSYRKPLPLDPSKFREMFRWMGLLMSSISRSQVGEDVAVPNIDWMKL